MLGYAIAEAPVAGAPSSDAAAAAGWTEAPEQVAIAATVTSAPAPIGNIDVTKVPLRRTVVFPGGIRTVVFKGGIRTTVFAGGTRTVRF